MGLYADLTAEQKGIVRESTNQLRALMGTLAQVIVQATTIQHAIDAADGLREIVTDLDNTETVPNESGLAGAHSLTRAEMAAIVALLDLYVTTFDTPANRQLMAQARGVLAGLN